MKVTSLALSDIKVLEPKVFEDNRGYFFESFNQKQFNTLIDPNAVFVQDNQSFSKYAVLRGLHYQIDPFAQGKLIRVLSGKIFDVAVDIREESKTYGHWVGEILSCENFKQLWIPAGYAHGFLTLSEIATVSYKATNFYSKKHEVNINFESFDIKWPILNKKFILSNKDS